MLFLWSQWLVPQFIQVSLLILTVLLFSRTVGKRRCYLKFGLWCLVILKGLTPPMVSAPQGVFCYLPRMTSDSPVIPAIQDDSARSSLQVLLDRQAESATTRSTQVSLAQREWIAEPLEVSVPLRARSDSHITRGFGAKAASWSWREALVSLWLCGICLGVARVLTRIVRLRKLLRRTQPVRSALLRRHLVELKRELGVKRCVNLVESPDDFGPAVVGLYRPTIVLPESITRSLGSDGLKSVLAHELTHVRRHDVAVGWAMTACQVIWWFQPLMGRAIRSFKLATEECCDDTAARLCIQDRASYARHLLDVVELTSLRPALAPFPGLRAKEMTKTRLENIMNARQGRLSSKGWFRLLVLLLMAAVVLPGAAQVQGQDDEYRTARRLSFPFSWWKKSKTRTEDTQDHSMPLLPAIMPDVNSDVPVVDAVKVRQTHDISAAIDRILSDDPELNTEQAQGFIRQFILQPEELFSEVQFDGDTVDVVCSAAKHEWIDGKVADLARFGTKQIVVEIRVLQAPSEVFDTLTIDWDLESNAPQGRGEFLDLEAGLELGENRATMEHVTEQRLPKRVKVLDDDEVRKLIQETRGDARGNILFAPKITLFNGQKAAITDSVQRPFLVSLKKVEDGEQVAMQPIVDVLEEGMKIHVRPELKENQEIWLQGNVDFSQIDDVLERKMKINVNGKAEKFTLQVPTLSRSTIKTSAMLPIESTLGLAGFEAPNANGDWESTIVLMTCRVIE